MASRLGCRVRGAQTGPKRWPLYSFPSPQDASILQSAPYLDSLSKHYNRLPPWGTVQATTDKTCSKLLSCTQRCSNCWSAHETFPKYADHCYQGIPPVCAWSLWCLERRRRTYSSNNACKHDHPTECSHRTCWRATYWKAYKDFPRFSTSCLKYWPKRHRMLNQIITFPHMKHLILDYWTPLYIQDPLSRVHFDWLGTKLTGNVDSKGYKCEFLQRLTNKECKFSWLIKEVVRLWQGMSEVNTELHLRHQGLVWPTDVSQRHLTKSTSSYAPYAYIT